MIHLFAPGEPVAKARARHRQVTTKAGKSFVHSYTPKKTASFEKYIAKLAQQQMLLRSPTRAPVKLDLVFFFSIPESWPTWKQKAAQEQHIAHTTKPDKDNLEKAVKDALNGIVWIDDAQVCLGSSQKLYSNEPGVLINVTELTLSPAQITRKDQLKIPGQQDLAA